MYVIEINSINGEMMRFYQGEKVKNDLHDSPPYQCWSSSDDWETYESAVAFHSRHGSAAVYSIDSKTGKLSWRLKS